jgi:glycosyltransferase involved in cell wall biosynthesis
MYDFVVPLTVLSIAYPFAPVGPDAVGGAEQILTTMDAALVRAGHRSIVIACEGSECQGELITLPLPARLDAAGQAAGHARIREVIADTLRRYPADLIHFHGIDFAAYLPRDGAPVLATLHLPLHLYPPEALFPRRPGTWVHCVSESQQRDCPPRVPLLPPVPNGVDLDRYRPGPRKRGYALAMGRICREKAFHEAFDAARKAGVSLVLAGEVFPYENHQRYFQEEIQPRLGPGAHFMGPLGSARKRRLLAGARCLVVSSRIAETSSLVSMEALACGTPVVAFRIGALPEIVDHGRTGFLVSNQEEMADALREVVRIDHAECRREAERRFSADFMAARYLDLYKLVLQEQPAWIRSR